MIQDIGHAELDLRLTEAKALPEAPGLSLQDESRKQSQVPPGRCVMRAASREELQGSAAMPLWYFARWTASQRRVVVRARSLAFSSLRLGAQEFSRLHHESE